VGKKNGSRLTEKKTITQTISTKPEECDKNKDVLYVGAKE
jgi:hypothetical protein